MIRSLCVIVRRPKGEELSTLGIRTAYAAHMGALDAKLVFVGDGVYNALSNPGYNAGMLADLLREDCPIYALGRDLAERGLDKGKVMEGVEIIGDAQVAELVAECAGVTAF